MEYQNYDYTKRVNTGNFEFEELKVSAKLDANESLILAVAMTKSDVKKALAAELTESKPSPVNVPAPAKVEETKAPAPKAEETKVEAPKVEEAKVEAPKEEKKPAKEKATKAPKATKEDKAANVVYNRTMESHKAEFASILNLIAADWRGTSAIKAKELSVKLENEKVEIFGADGSSLKSFEEKIKLEWAK
jgi:outer membrane biosynthesis protein TonB